MDTLIVGFGFKARHGKDTVAKMVEELLPAGTCRVMPFAYHLKAYARVLGMKGKDGTLLQALGTEVFRRLDPETWIRCHAEWVADEKPRVALVPDVRFKNECRYIARAGGLLYRVDRLNEDGSPYVAGDRDTRHQSETELEGEALFDQYFQARSGDMAELRRAAVTVAYGIRNRLEGRTPTVDVGNGPRDALRDVFVGSRTGGAETTFKFARVGSDGHQYIDKPGIGR